ncbi:MAG TPA: dihydropteroate synthase [Candidatus Binatia bacterium]|nr:dihydropteroate synthase [Candidatus Binatia bacterium]
MSPSHPADLNATVGQFNPLLPTFGQANRELKTRHGRIDFARRTAVMAVINVTPDSFFDGGRHFDAGRAVAAGLAMAEAGADVIDIGGESTRPGAEPVSQADELARVIPVIQGLRLQCALPISIDSYKARVARAALDAGADIVNDISALGFDPGMAPLIANEKVPVVLMHMRGTPRTMQADPHYVDVVREVRDFLAERLYDAMDAGIDAGSIVLDPGIGFGKTVEHNLQLLRALSVLSALGQPLLVGVSRKTFIGKILGLEPEQRLEGSLAAAVAAVLAGANIIRVHDVAETCRAVRIADALRFGFHA